MLRALLLLIGAASPALAAPAVTALAYSPDGKLLAAGTTQGGVAFVLPDAGKVAGELTGLPGRVTAAAFAADGSLAVACGEAGKNGVVRLYAGPLDPAKPPSKPRAEWEAHKDAVYALAFSPDGKTLATAGYDRLIHLWDVPPAGSAPRLVLKDHSDAVYGLAFRPDGKLLASCAADRTVKLWDASTGKRLYSLGDATDWLYSVCWLDGNRVAAGGVDKSVRTWEVNAEGGKLLRAAFAHEKPVARLLANGKHLISVGEDRVVKIWDAETLVEATVFPPRADTVQSAAVRPGGKQLALGLFNGTLELLDAETGKVMSKPLPLPPKPPVIGAVVPNAVIRGQIVRVTVSGTGVTEATAAASNQTGVTAKLLPEATADGKRVVELTATADAVIGAAQLTLKSAAGTSEPVIVWVDRFPLVEERGTSGAARSAQPISLPATVVGTLDQTGEVDFFRFTARAGEAVGVQFVTAVDASKFEPVMTLTDDSGAVVAEGRGRLGYVAPAAGSFAVGLRDQEYRGSMAHAYRLHVGPVPLITAVSPIGVPRGAPTTVRVRGVNLPNPDGYAVAVSPAADAKPGSKIAVPLPRTGGDPLGMAEVTVGEFPAVAVGSDGAGAIPAVPGTADGVLREPGASHAVRFPAKKDARLIVEVEASRLGSPVDSFLEIRDAAGKSVQSATLRGLSKSFVTLRDHDSSKPGIRMETWGEFAQNDYVLAGESLLRIHTLPRNPDDDCLFAQIGGKRRAYLGTTTQHHPFGAALYKVEIHPPGASFPPNGQPVVPLFFRNDDGGAGYGKDSKVVFDPPADGAYQAVVRDNTGAGGDSYAYRLTVRRPRPDFSVRLSPDKPTVPVPGGLPLTVTATRTDEFDGPIAVRFEGLPAGWSAPKTVIEAEQLTAEVPLTGGPEAAKKFRAIATAVIDGKEVVRTAEVTPKVDDTPDLVVATTAPTVTIAPGGEARLTVKLDRRGFKGRVPLDVKGLPHGVRVLNVGLNGILVLPGQTEREITIGAEPWVREMDRPMVVFATGDTRDRKAGLSEQFAAPAVTLQVRRATQAAGR